MTQIDMLKLNSGAGVIDVPVYEVSDTEYPVLRVNTNSGIGVINLKDPSAAEIDSLRVNTQYGILAVSTSIFIVESTLNGDSATLTLYEDIDGDGVAENKKSQVLTGGTDYLDASGFEFSDGNEFWWELNFADDGDTTDAGFIESIKLEGL